MHPSYLLFPAQAHSDALFPAKTLWYICTAYEESWEVRVVTINSSRSPSSPPEEQPQTQKRCQTQAENSQELIVIVQEEGSGSEAGDEHQG